MEQFFNQIGQFKKNAQGKIPSLAISNALLQKIIGLLFPILIEDQEETSVEKKAEDVSALLAKTLEQLSYSAVEVEEKNREFMSALPSIYQNILLDAEAIYMGDPAAESVEEVVVTYPGFYTIMVHRIAHQLYLQRIPILPRLFSEHAHGKTGIDIHPAAQIGKSFCIDHGTGIVIGETTTIGNNVKLYQGVTLGALSVDKAEAGTKRHPSIEDNVTIYAGATILGGKTLVGHNSVIGGNVWLTSSVEPYSTVLNQSAVSVRNKKK